MAVQITSEIGALRQVLVHTPGAELLGVTPGTREDYLYDDIIDVEHARREHRLFVAVLERFAEVLQVRDALAEIFAKAEVRDRLVARTLDVVPSDAPSAWGGCRCASWWTYSWQASARRRGRSRRR